MDLNEIRTHLRDELTPDKHEKGKYLCPLCPSGHGGAGSTGAFSIERDGVHGHCFSCGFYGDIFDLEAAKTGLSLPEATRAVMARYDFLPSTGSPKAAAAAADFPPEPPKDKKNFTGFINLRHNAMIPGCAGQHYFMRRGLTQETIDRFNLGYDENYHLPGVGGTYGAVVIPYNKEGTFYSVRMIRDDLQRKHDNPTGIDKELFNPDALYKDQPCFVVESAICAMSIEQEGGSAVALGGCGSTNLLIKAIKQKKPSALLILSLDNDEPGQKAQAKLAADLSDADVHFVELNISGECKDPNELLVNNRDELRGNIASAVSMAKLMQKAEAEKEREEYEGRTTAAAFAEFVSFLDVTGNNPPISTGFSALDRMLNGGLTTGLYIMGALSSLGKTSWMLNIADNIAAAGRDVLYFSLEMSKSELIAKSLSRLSFLSAGELCSDPAQALSTFEVMNSRGKLKFTEPQKIVLAEAIDRYKNGPGKHMWIFEGVGDFGVNEIAKRVEDHVRITGNHPVVFLDYLQILAPTDIHFTDKQNTDVAVRELKRMSRDHDIPVFAISSLNRSNYSETINMASFKESGAIEYGSDVLIGVQLAGIKDAKDKKERDKIADKAEGNPQVEIEVRVLKNRNGARGGSGRLLFDKKYNFFSEVDDGFTVIHEADNPFDDEDEVVLRL